MSKNSYQATEDSSTISASSPCDIDCEPKVQKLDDGRTEWDYRSISYSIAACLLCDMSYSMLVTFFPQAAAERGLSVSETGIIFSSYQIANVIGTFFVPTINSYLGGIQTLKYALLGQVIATAAMCFTDSIHTPRAFFSVCVCLRFLSGLIASLAEVSGMGLTLRSAPRDQVGEAYGILESARMLGTIFGPTMAAGLVSAFGYVGPFSFASACFGSVFIFTYFVPLDPTLDGVGDENEAKKKRTAFFSTMKMPMMWVYAINILLVATALTFLEPTLAPYLEKDPFNLPSYAVGLIYMTIFVSFIIFNGIASYISDSLNYTQTCIIGLSCLPIGYLILAPPQHMTGPLSLFAFLHQPGKAGGIGTLIAGFTLVGAGMGLPISAFITLMTGEAEYNGFGVESSSDAIGSIMNVFFSAGNALGPFLGGIFTQAVDFQRACSLFGYVSILGLVIFATGTAITKANRDPKDTKNVDSEGEAKPLVEEC